MSKVFRTACLLMVGCTTLVFAGCTKKSMQTGGDTSRSKMTTQKDDVSYNGLESAKNGVEDVRQDALLAKADPMKANKQLEEIRAEQRATAASGLRDVFFGYDSWMISEEGRQILARNAEWLRAHNTTQIKVEGHCDERGSSSYNFVLAEKRAKAVRNYLIDLGIKGDRLTVVSYGKERPFCNEHNESCYQQNRRGHVVVRP
jgi:peptidoglycan-associated lipoprotein